MSSISLIIDSLKNMITFISLILSHLFHHPRPDFSHKSGRGPTTKSVAARITGNDVGVVMRRLRLPHHEPFSQDSVENIEGIFEGAEPVLEEVREAFRTFDENDDGFVDAEELEKCRSSKQALVAMCSEKNDGNLVFGLNHVSAEKKGQKLTLFEDLLQDSDAVNSNSDVFNGNSCPSDCESGVSGAENKIGNSVENGGGEEIYGIIMKF
ncbi:hypothetical protein SASPL_155717 [Salvia splendens]|uniref:EF-hand domain-containing protein n=1 Tax=Salvia splendens TaxID=180675 RepID=A0A8X8YXY0_SALSN|nr:hypothetical protein SASPL_155717 [Salvia splendens]